MISRFWRGCTNVGNAADYERLLRSKVLPGIHSVTGYKGARIARAGHGVVPAGKAEAYFEYLSRTGVADYQATPGNRGVYVLRRVEGRQSHFLLIPLWESGEAIRAFAGQDMERARYYPEDEAFLVHLEPRVTHYQVLVSPASTAVRRPASKKGGSP